MGEKICENGTTGREDYKFCGTYKRNVGELQN